jgi:AhpD family alkylhydroperoxidase
MSTSHARMEWKAFGALAPEVNAAVQQLGGLAAAHGLDKGMLELMKLRASQINGCAFCVSYHVLEGQRLGIPAEKMHMVAVWHETPIFDARERAALAWTEALTRIAEGVPDAVYEQVQAAFSEQELAYLTSAVLAINAWNRLAISYRYAPLRIPSASHAHAKDAAA